MTHPLRFGMLSGAGDPQSWQRDVARAEHDGYSTIVLTGHLDLSGAHVTRLSWLPAFAHALARSSRLHASVMVANQDLRHPAVLAREVTTLDRLSGGRMELGLGAGWTEQENAWAGIELSVSVPIVAGGSGSPTAELERAVAADPFARRLASRMSIDALAATALTLAGTTTAIIDRLQEWRERHGVSSYVVPAESADTMAPVVAQLTGGLG